MKIFKKILLALLAVVLVVVLFFVILYFTRLQTISSIKKCTDYEDGYNLYTMDVKYDYDIDDIIYSYHKDTQEFVNAVIKESLPLLPVKIKVPSYGCSAIKTKTTDGNVLMGRNYDFKLDTSCLLVRCTPKHGYKSISFAALNNVSADNLEASFSKKMAALTAPFIGLDGVNEKGVSIAVLTLPSEPTMHDTGKGKLATSILIRLVLDKAATTEEALELIKNYDIFSSNGRDYHFFISDATGNSVAVEFDCDNEERPMVVTPTDAITNFYIMYPDKVVPGVKDPKYGSGKDRYLKMLDVTNKYNNEMTRKTTWEAIKAAVQEPNPDDITSNTQWTIVYDNTNCNAEIAIRRHFNETFIFDIQ